MSEVELLSDESKLPADWLPPGWAWILRTNDAQIAAGPWTTFGYGRDLQLTPTEAWIPPDNVSTKDAAEEGIETLLLLNLQALWPHLHLVLKHKSLRGWAGADIEASDPAGIRHAFEVKFGAPATHVVDQALAYALGVVSEAANPQRHFRELSGADRQRFIACRIGAFWTKSRADKWQRNTELPPAERDWQALADKLETAKSTLTVTELKAVAANIDKKVSHEGRIPTTLAGAHFHLVVPDPRKIAPAQIQAWGRLKWRGANASVWQVALDHGAEGGRLSIRACWIPPIDPTKSGWKPDSNARPYLPRMSEIVASAAAIDPAISAAAFSINRRDELYSPQNWNEKGPAVHLERHWNGVNHEMTMKVAVDAPPSLWAEYPDHADAIVAGRYAAVQKWILRVAGPATGSAAAASKRVSKKWAYAIEGRPVEAWHSGGQAQAAVTWVPGDVEKDGALLAKGLAVARELGLEYAEAFARGER